MRTAMQELIDILKEIKENKCKTLQETLFFDGILAVIDGKNYLGLEKHQITNAYDYSINTGGRTAEEYYQETFSNSNHAGI